MESSQEEAARSTLALVFSDMLHDELCDLEDNNQEVELARTRPWAQPWLLGRDEGKLSVFETKVDLFSEEKFKSIFRLSRGMFNELLEKVSPMITRRDTQMRRAIAPHIRLQITLMFLASGCRYPVLENLFSVSVSSISGIVQTVCSAIWELRSDYLKCPTRKSEWLKVAKGFKEKWQYPRAIGALDGKHCQVQCFGNSGSVFHNYKGTFSLVLMALVDADGKLLFCDIGAQGASNDSAVFQNTSFYKAGSRR